MAIARLPVHGRASAVAILVIAAFVSTAVNAQRGSECTSPVNFVWGETIRGWTVGQELTLGGACGNNRPYEGSFSWFRTTVAEAAAYTVQVAMASNEFGKSTTVYVYVSESGSCENLQCVFQATSLESTGFIRGPSVVYLSVSTGLMGAGFVVRTILGNGTYGGGQQTDLGTCGDVPVITLRGMDAPEHVFLRKEGDMALSRLPSCPSLAEPKPVAWLKFVATVTANYTIQIIDTWFDTVISVYSGPDATCANLTCVSVNDDGNLMPWMSYLQLLLHPGINYFVAVHGYEYNQTGDFALAVTYEDWQVSGNCPSAPIVVLDANTSLLFQGGPLDMPMATVPACPGFLSWAHDPMAWYKFTTLNNAIFTFQVESASFDSTLTLADSPNGTCQGLACTNMNDNGGADGQLSRMVLVLQAGKVYYLAVRSQGRQPGNFTLSVTYGKKEVICFGAQELVSGLPTNGTTEGREPTMVPCGMALIFAHIVWYYIRVVTTGEHSIQLVNATNPNEVRIVVMTTDASSNCDNLKCADSGIVDDPFAPRLLDATAGSVVYFLVLTMVLPEAGLADTGGENFTLVVRGPPEEAVTSPGHVLLIVLLTVLLGSAALASLALLVFRRRLFGGPVDEEAVNEFLRKRNPPQRGMPIAAIITDIEGSTSLWEWDPTIMKKALAIHHNVVRTLLPKYYGYESDTEGDSFTLVFHSASDAIGWAMEAQRHLLYPLNLFNSTLPQANQNPFASPPKNVHPSIDVAHADWPPQLLSFGTGAEVQDVNSGQVLYRGLRVRMGIHVGVPEAVLLHPNGRQHYKGEVMEVAKAVQDAAASGGQVLLSMLTWQSVGIEHPAVVRHHMGLHEVGEKLPPVHLLQVIPEELVKRAPYKPLKSKQLTPSFFDAPSSQCYLTRVAPTDPIVIGFIYVGGAKALRRQPGYQDCIDMLVTFVEERMRRFDAYEVEEKDGNFLLAFRSAAKAAQFAEAVQREAMGLAWAQEILEHEAAAEVVKPAQSTDGTPTADVVVFRGLRLQIGMCMDIPSDCQPHMATGRAAYFGPIVNRAARIAATAACGQTLANHTLYESAKAECPGLLFLQMGNFELKGVQEPMHLFQISSPALSTRLFPRTLKLAKDLMPAIELEPSRASDKGDQGQGESVTITVQAVAEVTITKSPKARKSGSSFTTSSPKGMPRSPKMQRSSKVAPLPLAESDVDS